MRSVSRNWQLRAERGGPKRAKIKIHAPTADFNPINALAGAEIRCKFRLCPQPRAKPTLRASLAAFRNPPFCAIRWREPRRFDHAGRTARTTGASFCLMRWVVRNDHGRPRGRVRGRETRFPSLPTNLKTVAALYCKICLARCLSNSGKGVSAILHMADRYEPRHAI